MLGVVGLIAGALQLLAGVLKLGQWFRAISPSVIHGMLAGIGVLIFASQFHVMLDDAPRSGGLANIIAIPEAIIKAIPVDGSVHHLAAMAGFITIVTIIAWNKFKPKSLALLPGPLLGVLIGTAFAFAFALPITLVELPANLTDA
ncbi:MAG: SulP family inorganic anion transporter, partial [Erythrobacter sp.]